MLTPGETLLIGYVAGLAFGYAVGFFVARGIYRGTWIN